MMKRSITLSLGSPLIKAIDDPIVGHCEECDGVFCIECAKVIGAGGERSLSNMARLAEGHSKSCPELMPMPNGTDLRSGRTVAMAHSS